VDGLYRSTLFEKKKKSHIAIRQVMITYYPNLPYLVLSYHI
jgi:hypothetical protein